MATILAHAICSVDEAKTWLGITSSTDDSLLTNIVNNVTDFIERYLNRQVRTRSADIEEIFSGDDTAYYIVENPPINSALDEIYIEDVVTLDSDDCADDDQVRYDPDTGEIWLIQYTFNTYWPRNCKVTYSGGWNAPTADTYPLPYDIWQAARELVASAYRLKDKQKEDFQSISSPTGETVTYFIDVMRPETKAKLDPYKIVRLG